MVCGKKNTKTQIHSWYPKKIQFAKKNSFHIYGMRGKKKKKKKKKTGQKHKFTVGPKIKSTVIPIFCGPKITEWPIMGYQNCTKKLKHKKSSGEILTAG